MMTDTPTPARSQLIVTINAHKRCKLRTTNCVTTWTLGQPGSVETSWGNLWDDEARASEAEAIDLLITKINAHFVDLPALWAEQGSWWPGECTITTEYLTDTGQVRIVWRHGNEPREFVLLEDCGLARWAEAFVDCDPEPTDIWGLDEYDALSRLIRRLRIEDSVDGVPEYEHVGLTDEEYTPKMLDEWVTYEIAAWVGRQEGDIEIAHNAASNQCSITTHQHRVTWQHGFAQPECGVETLRAAGKAPLKSVLIAAAHQFEREHALEEIMKPSPMPAEYPRGQWLITTNPRPAI